MQSSMQINTVTIIIVVAPQIKCNDKKEMIEILLIFIYLFPLK